MDSNSNMASNNIESETSSVVENCHNLYDKWVMYAHLPHDTDWSIHSYKNILELENVEQCISLFEAIPNKMSQNCMLFLMKNNIKPMWEDIENRNGGCISFKVPTHVIPDTWKDLCYRLIGNTLCKDKERLSKINGITISPKRNFCIIKIWTKDCSFKDISNLQLSEDMDKKTAIFKKHKPEF